jgi:colanic acid biosynthesis protein WcaH
MEIIESLGAFEHIYQIPGINCVDTKHYLANGYIVDVTSSKFQADDQQEELRVFQSAPDSLHQNIYYCAEAAERLRNGLCWHVTGERTLRLGCDDIVRGRTEGDYPIV